MAGDQSLERLLRNDRNLRVAGFDDTPFTKVRGGSTNLCGVICALTRFEGMVWDRVRQDGWNATDSVCRALEVGKFLPQLHIVLLDGINFAGFNIVDLPLLHERLGLPCVAVMRRLPRMNAFRAALQNLSRPKKRLAIVERAGTIYQRESFTFQVQGASPDVTAQVLARLTDRGKVPEALRLAHLIGSAVKTGESSNRA